MDNLPEVASEFPPLLAKYQNDPSISPEKLKAASKQLRTLEHGAHAMVPLFCKGTTCMYKGACPLLKAGINDMAGDPCPIEGHLLNLWGTQYVKDLRVDEHNLVEMNLIGELAKLDIYSMRISNRMAYEDFIADQVISVDDNGQPIYRQELHVGAQWEDMLTRRKLKLLDALLATRRSIAEVGGGHTADPSSQAARVRSVLDKANKNLQQKAEDAIVSQAKPIN